MHHPLYFLNRKVGDAQKVNNCAMAFVYKYETVHALCAYDTAVLTSQ
jgi:hypothetical protein